MNPAATARVGVDVGGTFTDVVVLRDGQILTAKVQTVQADQSVGVLAGIHRTGVDPSAVEVFAHGTTAATNTLLERRGARTAMLTTDGFRDVIEIGRQNRAELYDLAAAKPPPLVPRSRRLTLVERTTMAGVEVAPTAEALADLVEQLREMAPTSVAICLLFSFAHPSNERAVAAAIRAALPDVHVSVSSEVLPEFREYERFSTTVADAYLAPSLSRYLARLRTRAMDAGLPNPLVMQSSGGVLGVDEAAGQAVGALLSGPAGGVVGAAYVAAASGYPHVLTFDMGGTSTDVAAVLDGGIQSTTESVVAGVPIKLPMVDVHTVSAGGGSIAWVDDGAVLRVGPRSAGADPGPAAYGKGGGLPTTTDANLLLGYLPDGLELGGAVRLDLACAETAMTALASRLGLALVEAAEGVVRVANSQMIAALRVISVERGLDPRDFALVAYGGAGPLHACAVAEELGMTHILVPRLSGVLSALGLVISDLRRDYVRSVIGRPDTVSAAFDALQDQAGKDLPAASLRRFADARYVGQSFELTVPGADVSTIGEAFQRAHFRRYGYHNPHASVEVVNVRLVATVDVPRPRLDEAPVAGDACVGTRTVRMDGSWVHAPVLSRPLMGCGSTVEGPAVVELAEATCVLRPGWSGRIDQTGTLCLAAGP